MVMRGPTTLNEWMNHVLYNICAMVLDLCGMHLASAAFQLERHDGCPVLLALLS